jgi:uncharacterized protein
MTDMQPSHRTSDALRRVFLAFTGVLVLACVATVRAQSAPLQDLDTFPKGELTINDGKKVHYTFHVWLADNPQRMAQGLMFVRSLPELRGMLFVHPEPRPISMWMKNTYIPLDMVFIDATGRIQQIVEQTTPHSLSLIQSRDPAKAVLEIGGGEAKRLGLHPGQRVVHPALVGP